MALRLVVPLEAPERYCEGRLRKALSFGALRRATFRLVWETGSAPMVRPSRRFGRIRTTWTGSRQELLMDVYPLIFGSKFARIIAQRATSGFGSGNETVKLRRPQT